MSGVDPDGGIVWFTRARRIPRYIGKLASGERIWGGPYQASQAVVFIVVWLLGWAAMPLWGRWGVLNWAVLLPLAAAAGYSARWLPQTSVNPVLMGAGVFSLLVSRGRYRHRGRVLVLPPARWVASGARVLTPPVPTHAREVSGVGRVERPARQQRPAPPPEAMAGAEAAAAAVVARYAQRLHVGKA